MVMTMPMTRALSPSPSKPDITADAMRISTKKSLYCSKKILRTLFFFPSVRQFHPSHSRRTVASRLESPSGVLSTCSRVCRTVC